MAEELMTVNWVCNGKADRIPKIGDKIPFKDEWLFVVEAYGASHEERDTLYKTGWKYTIELKGHLMLPAGSSIDAFERLLKDGEL